jgi:hypothetical protein
MDKLASWSRGVARVLIAGLLAWALVTQGSAIAALARAGGSVGDVVAEFDRCSANGGSDDHRHSPERHLPCSCCAPCRSSALGGFAGLPAAAPTSADLFFPVVDVGRAGFFRVVERAALLGWISSWSQRAPPTA